MNIVVCVKQVPDVDDIKWTKENNLDRSLMLSKINKYDDWAIDWAVKIRSQFKDARLTAISMGPKQANEVLNYALAKGADRAILLCDKMFAASDTLATSKVLACAIRKYVSDFNIIITGQMAEDGDTAQVPVSVSQLLNIVDITYCEEIFNADKNSVIASRKIDDELDIVEVKTPCLIAVNKHCSQVKTPKINDYIRAQNTGVEIYNMTDLNLSKEDVGIIGSPTVVNKAFRPEIKKEPLTVNQEKARKILDLVLKVK